MKATLSILKCATHGFYAISVEREGHGHRLTSGKCCGTWSTLRSWEVDSQTLRATADWLESPNFPQMVITAADIAASGGLLDEDDQTPAEREIDELRKDRRRLDWLSENPTDMGGFMGVEPAKCWCFYGARDKSLRDIVDEALARLERDLEQRRVAPVPTVDDRNPDTTWVIWSRDHQGWWGPNRGGYFDSMMHAGLYTEEEARAIGSRQDYRAGSLLQTGPSDPAMTWRQACDFVARGYPDSDFT